MRVLFHGSRALLGSGRECTGAAGMRNDDVLDLGGEAALQRLERLCQRALLRLLFLASGFLTFFSRENRLYVSIFCPLRVDISALHFEA